jgi:hypothetical protein
MRVYLDENFSRYFAHAFNSLETADRLIEVVSVHDLYAYNFNQSVSSF